MARKEFLYTFGIAVFAAIGTFFFGFDSGIATTTIAHQSWIDYMDHPSEALTGAVPSVYVAGEAVGALIQTFLGDRLGRIRFLQVMCITVTIGVTIQTAAINMAMFLAGRILAGIAVGGLVGTVPVYLIEISAPYNRGLIGGISGCGITFGAMVSNWVGFACSYAPYGAVQWRLPLAIQIPWGMILFCGLATFMPDSPRQLLRKGKPDKARAEFVRVRRDLHADDALKEFAHMRMEIESEMARELTGYRQIFRVYRHRALASISVQTMTTFTGVNVILYYQTTLYKSLGVPSNTILALAGVYGTCGFVSNALTTVFLNDQWGRRKMLLAGMSGTVLILIYTAVMQKEFQHADSKIGKGFTILGIYVSALALEALGIVTSCDGCSDQCKRRCKEEIPTYANVKQWLWQLFAIWFYGMIGSTTWVYGAEVLPMAIRSKVMGLAAASHFMTNVAVTEIGPIALATIEENYYYVFVGCTSFFFIIAYFYFPETRHKTLEEIAAAFGDATNTADDHELQEYASTREMSDECKDV